MGHSLILYVVALAGLRVEAQAPTLPAGFRARWAAGRLRSLGGDGAVSTWADTTSSVNLAASQVSTASQPQIVQEATYCLSSLRFDPGDYLNVADAADLDPEAGGFGVFAVMRVLQQRNPGWAFSKGQFPGGHSWGLAVNGDTVRAAASQGGNAYTAERAGFADTRNFHSWMLDITENVPGAGRYARGFLDGMSFTGPNNTYTVPLRSPAEPLVIGSNTAAGRTFSGELLELLVYKGTVSDADRNSVSGFLDHTYYLTCPNRTAAPAFRVQQTGTCEGARQGASCAQACESGATRLYGGAAHTCGVGQWSAPRTLCGATCPSLLAPAGSGSCSRRLEDVPSGGFTAAVMDTLWQLPAVPEREKPAYWRVDGAGALFTEAGRPGGVCPATCDPASCAFARPSALVFAAPRWLDQVSPSSITTLSATVRFNPAATPAVINAAGRAGAVLHYADAGNHVRVWVTAPDGASTSGNVTLEVVRGGVASTLGFTPLTLAEGQDLHLQVFASGASVRVSLDQTAPGGAPPVNRTQRLNVTAASLGGTGSVGFLSDGVASFSGLRYEVDCGSAGVCDGAHAGQACVFGCAAGYAPVGDAARSCDGATSNFGGAPLTCTIVPPVINASQLLTVPENAGADTPVGRPLGVSHPARGVTYGFSIVSEDPPPLTPGRPRFGIQSCSGQIVTSSSDSPLNFEAQAWYTLTIRVVPNGVDASAATAVVTVNLTDVAEAPRFSPIDKPLARRNVSENVPAGTAVGAPLNATDEDRRLPRAPIVFFLEQSGGGVFAIGNTSGQISVATAGAIDFEGGPREYLLKARAWSSGEPGLFDVTDVLVTVLNANDPPLLGDPQAFEVPQASARIAAVLSEPIAFSDEDLPSDSHTWTLSGPDAPMFNVTTVGGRPYLLFAAWPTLAADPFVQDGRLCVAAYSLTLQVRDAGGLTDTASVRVYVIANVTTVGSVPLFSGLAAPQNIPTNGGTQVTLTGSNFPNPAGGWVINATYGGTFGTYSRTYVAQACAWVDAGTITCNIAPGAGRSLAWELAFIQGGTITRAVRTSAVVMSYAAPTITGVAGGTGADMPTRGGSLIRLLGSNLGYEPQLITLSYGPAANALFPAAVANASHGSLDAVSTPGGGSRHVLRINVGGWEATSTPATGTVSYGRPLITRIRTTASGPCGYTKDDLPLNAWSILLEGENFGPASNAPGVPPTWGPGGMMTFRAVYGTWVRSSLGLGGESFTTPAGGWELRCSHTSCPAPAVDVHQCLTCFTPVGGSASFGTNLTLRAEVFGQQSEFSHVTAGPADGFLSHQAPTITSVTGPGTRNADTAGGQTLLIEGEGLGPDSMSATDWRTPTQLLDVRYGPSTANSSVLGPGGARLPFSGSIADFDRAYPYRAVGCRVVRTSATCRTGATSTRVGLMECSTGEKTLSGPSTNLELAFRVGVPPLANFIQIINGTTHFSPPFANAVSYGPPVLSFFEGPGASGADTRGRQTVTLVGRNLGSNASLLNISYSVALDPATFAGVPNGVNVGDGGRNLVTMRPTDCNYTVPHSVVTCNTSVGGGGSLKWSVVVDGVPSREPFTSYAQPVVTNLTLFAGPAGTVPIPQASPAGGDVLVISGANFGPPRRGGPSPPEPVRDLVQWVRISVQGGRASFLYPASWTVVSHDRIDVTLPSGYGSSCRVEVMVADQSSGLSGPTFAYQTPEILSMTPVTGPTVSTPEDPVIVTLVTRYLPAPSASSAQLLVSFGNPGDGTLNFFSGGAPISAVRGPALQGFSPPRFNVTFALPSGLGVSRRVQLALRDPSLGVAGDQLALGQGSFTYRAPDVDYLTFEPRDVPPFSTWLNSVVPAAQRNSTRVITLHGSGFGPRSIASVQRRVMINTGARNVTLISGGWNASQGGVVASPWSDGAVTILTTQTSGSVWIEVISRGPDGADLGTGARLVQASAPLDISPTRPSITRLLDMPLAGFPSAGGVVVGLEVPYGGIASVGTSLNVSFAVPTGSGVRRMACPLLNIDWENAAAIDTGVAGYRAPLPETQALALAQRSCREKFGGALDNVSPCRLWCTVPEGQGATVPVQLTKDGVGSAVAMARYEAPTVTSVTLRRLDGSNSVVYTNLAVDTILLPTNGYEVVISGSSLGLCPQVLFGDSAVNTCVIKEGPGGGALVSHNSLTVPVPAGEGRVTSSGANMTLRVVAGGQPNAPPAGGSPGRGGNITIAYRPPTIRSITSTAPTRGNVTFVITGDDFGAPNSGGTGFGDPTVTFSNDFRPYPPFACSDVTRLSHSRIECVLPEGSGDLYKVALCVAGQCSDSLTAPSTGGTSAGYFGYARPSIASVTVEQWNATVFDSWPARWANRSAEGYRPTGVTFPVTTTPTRGGFSRGPTNGRYLVTIRGSSFGPRRPRENCVFVTVNSAARACDTLAVNTQPACLCQLISNPQTDPACDRWSWVDRNFEEGHLASMPLCDGLDTFPGEGEIYDDGASWAPTNPGADPPETHPRTSDPAFASGFVVSWTHEEVVFSMPPGAGHAVITVGARGSFPVWYNESFFRYDPPQFTEVRKLDGKISAAGGDRVLITGRNLGYGYPKVEGIVGNASGTIIPSMDAMLRTYTAAPRTLPLPESAMVPAFGAVVRWSRVCMTSSAKFVLPPPAAFPAFPYADAVCGSGPESRPNRDPSRFTILSHTHGGIIVRAHPGIGAGRNLSLVIHGPQAASAAVVTSAMGADGLPQIRFSYDPPTVTSVREVPILIGSPGDARSAVRIEVYAENIGTPDDEDELADAEKVPRLEVGWEIARDAARVLSGVEGQGRVLGPHISGQLSNQTVGYARVQLTIAGQTGITMASDPLAPLVACAAGYYGNWSETCEPCPMGALCEGYDRVRRVHRFPRAAPKYYILDGSPVTYLGVETTPYALACPNRTSRPAGCVVGCVPPEACIGDNLCAVGYLSRPPDFRCANCDKGFYRRNGDCVKCPDVPILQVIGFVLLALFAVGVGYILNSKNVNIAFLAIGIDYLQVISMLAQTRISWPPQIKELLHILSAFNLNLEITAPECLMPEVSYVQKWSAVMTLPLAAGFIFLSMFAGRYLFARFVLRQKGRSFLNKGVKVLTSMFLMICYFMYLYVTRTLFEVFNCVPAQPDDGRWYLASGSGLEECGKPGGTQMTLVPFAVVGLLLYTVGYPAFVARVIYRNAFLIMEDQLLRAKGVGDTKLTNPHAYHLRRQYGRLYYAFRPTYVWWILVIIARKLLIAFATLMFRNEAQFQLAVMMLVLFGAYALQVRHDPFMSPATRDDVLRDHERARFEGGVHARLAAALEGVESVARKRTIKSVDWGAPRAAVLRDVAHKAVKFVFDYNTLESVLLGSAALVCLGGIMIESLTRRSASERASALAFSTDIQALRAADQQCAATYAGYCSGVTWALVFLITFTIVYFLGVLVVEIHSALQAAAFARASAARRESLAKKLGVSRKELAGRGVDASTARVLAKMAESGASQATLQREFEARSGYVASADVNPLFVKQGAGGAAAAAAARFGEAATAPPLTTDDLANVEQALHAAGDAPPPPEVWRLLREQYSRLLAANRGQETALAEMRLHAAAASAAPDGAGGDDDAGFARHRGIRGGNSLRASFSPSAAHAGPPAAAGHVINPLAASAQFRSPSARQFR